jgi:outer membrane usher protein
MQWLCRTVMISQLLVICGIPQAYPAGTATTVNADIPLYLSVNINGQHKDLIAEFVRDGSGRFRSKASELREVGIDPGDKALPDTWIYLDGLPQVSYVYNENEQQISFTVDPSRMTLRTYNMRGTLDNVPLTKSDVGVALNYSLSGQLGKQSLEWRPQFNGASTFLDGRLFAPAGTLTQTGLVSLRSADDGLEVQRHDTRWSRSFPDQQLTASVGDIISGGLGWTRSIRMGGVQLRRNFSTRPDLITYPLPSLSGTAAVPSTVDIYLGKLRLNSIDVETGRFQLNNLPVPNENGDLRLVVQDSTGALREQIIPFASSRALLRSGLTDFSAEVGGARTGFATDQDAYVETPVAVGSLRHGFNDAVTIEGHTEIGSGLANLGVGIVAASGGWGTTQLALAGSMYHGRYGSQLAATYDYSFGRGSFKLDARRALGTYFDLADATTVGGPDFSNADRITSYERFQLNTQLWDDLGSVGLGYAHTTTADKHSGHVVNASFTRPIGAQSQFAFSAQAQFGDEHSLSANAGLSFTLGANRNGSAGVSYADGRISADMSASKTLRQEPGNMGYGASLRRNGTSTSGNLIMSRYGETNLSTAVLSATDNDLNMYGNLEGGVAFIDGDVFLSQRIDDSFAVVDAGAPNIGVYHENHKIGRTNGRGKLLVPGVRSYEFNKLAIEPDDLPVSSTISETSRLISIPERSGAVVKFSGAPHADNSAIVTLRDAKGEFLPPGSAATLAGSSEALVVGYDGEVFVTDLKTANEITVDTGGSTCRGVFAFQGSSTSQPRIGPIECR